MSGEPVPVSPPPRLRSLHGSLPTQDNNVFLTDLRRKRLRRAARHPALTSPHVVSEGQFPSQTAGESRAGPSFHSYPLIIRAGGLIEALGPEVATRKVDSQTGDMTIQCRGFNTRNLGPRATPCDQDYLRKLAKDTDAKKLEQWYNHHVAQLYRQLDAYDEEGIFIGDGSYLFVPNNENYEGSKRLLFNEHNHPVSKEEAKKMTPAQRDRCQWRRC